MTLLETLAHKWLLITTPYSAPEAQAARFRAHQLNACLRLAPWVLLANTLNSGFVLWLFLTRADASVPDYLPFVWMLLVFLTSALGLQRWRLMRRGEVRNTASMRTLSKFTRNAAISSLLWAAFFAWTYPHMDPMGQKITIAIAVGMICAGGFVFSSIPRAALSYVLIMALGFDLGLLRNGLNQEFVSLTILLFGYVALVISTIFSMAQNMGARLLAETESSRQAELVGLLLSDFESNTNDWLWELNARGELEHVSVRMAEVLGQSKESLLGTHLQVLFKRLLLNPGPDEEAALLQLQSALDAARAFKRLDIPVCTSGEQQWWSLSGKPLFSDAGELMGWRGVGSDVTRARKDADAMNRLANFDSLTGLANRHQFQQRLYTLAGRPCTLLLLDLDNFKTANDHYGHATGDKVLQIVASRFKSQIRTGDLLARLGGDEFALIARGDAELDAYSDLALRLIECLREPLSVDGVQVRVGTSVGIATTSDGAGDPDALLQFADMALYAAKDAGRNTYCFFSSGMKDQAQKRLALIDDLRIATERQQFELLYQPQVSLLTGQLTGVEALIRWRHPVRGLVSPGEFIALAEQTNLILPLGRWVLQQACAQAAAWASDVPVAVNISVIQFGDAGFVPFVQETLRRTGLPAQRLELEITESLLIEDRHAVLDILRELRALGVRIALDDFGTGYSSLAYLRNFPIHKLKIDGAFVRRISESAQAYAIVQTIIDLGRALHLDLTAECIETPEQFAALRTLGCGSAQGYWIARPMPADALVDGQGHWCFALPAGLEPLLSEQA
nr:EAL domain-containing protein [uncultured Rhodoferax sp.]